MAVVGRDFVDRNVEPSRESSQIDLDELVIVRRNKQPIEIAPESALQSRRRFLEQSLVGRTEAEKKETFERIINGDELQPINYLERGMITSRAVALISINAKEDQIEGAGGAGTGFLIAPNVLITNNHVLPDQATASNSIARFCYEIDLEDRPIGPVNFRLDPNRLFHTSKDLDFTVVAIEGQSIPQGVQLSQFGFLPLLDVEGKASEGEWLTIVQYPSAERKQLCMRENQLVKRGDDFLWYSTDTTPGSSGSPVFNNDWYVVALHHSGVPEKRGDSTITRDGRIYDPNTMRDSEINWIANEGARASRITQVLKKDLPDHPLLLPLFNATPQSARVESARLGSITRVFNPTSHVSKENVPMTASTPNAFPLNITMRVRADGSVEVLQAGPGAASEGYLSTDEAARRKPKQAANFDAPFESDYSKRNGFNENLLGSGAKRIQLPRLSNALEQEAVPLIIPEDSNKFVLNYHNYSVVMHKARRLAIYSAASVTFGKRYELSRPPDVWRRDPRIAAEHQVENWYYADNKFDRGHLTRREDLEFGDTPVDALQSAADTCHWTNCTPQHAKFNQNKEIWQGVERYILEESIYNGKLNAQIITGPVLDSGDPKYRKIRYPLQFWKVVVALKSDDKLFATAYIASQEEVIAQYGIEVTEAPFGAYKTYQTSIEEIERLTALTFRSGDDPGKSLKALDPLSAPGSARARRRVADVREKLGSRAPNGYYEITDLDDIQT